MIKNSVITADIHCDNHKPFSKVLPGGINSRLQACLNVLNDIYKYALNKRKSSVIILGDLFHSRTAINTIVYEKVFSLIREQKEIDTILLVGNHDQAIKNGEIHSLIPFRELRNVIVIDTPQKIKNAYFVPYKEHLSREDFNGDADFFLGHFGITGAAVGASNYLLGETTSPKQLARYKQAFCGHFHKAQTINNVWIPGSPLQHSFGERGEEKGFLDIGRNYEINFIQTTTPQFRQIEVNSEQDVKDINPTDYVQFVVKTKKVKNINFETLSENCKVVMDLPRKHEERLEIKNEDSDIDIFNNYLQKFRTPLLERGLSLEKLKEINGRLWKQYYRAQVGDK